MIHLRRFYFSLRCVFGLRLCRFPCGKPPAFRQARDSFGGSAALSLLKAFRTGGGTAANPNRGAKVQISIIVRLHALVQFAPEFLQ